MLTNLLIVYVLIGVVIAAVPVFSPSFGKNFDHMKVSSILIGSTLVLISWPLIVFVALSEALKAIRRDNER